MRGSDLIATVRIGGTDDPKGLDGFSLAGLGKVSRVTSSTCSGVTAVATQCSLTFATTGMAGTSRQLIFKRADQQLLWVLVV
jgi:hypothetical protein